MKLPSWVVALIASAALAQEKQMTRFDFEPDEAGRSPKGFELALTGKGKPGTWVVQSVNDAPSGKKVLAQTDGDTTDYRFPIAYTGPEMKDLRLSVKCKAIAGKGDQGCGIVWRLKDKDNYTSRAQTPSRTTCTCTTSSRAV